MKKAFTCSHCNTTFYVPQQALDKYPNWKPNRCFDCRDKQSPKQSRAKQSSPQQQGSSKELNLSLNEVLKRFTGGPNSGLFTDGACSGNPGPGGWGVVWVKDGAVLKDLHGHDPQTTNNRMELVALIEAYKLLANDAIEVIYSDSQLCVNTINEWAAGWEKRGWRRKGGEIKNLDLVQHAYTLSKEHPHVELKWIKAHNGSRWNEYADSLATAFMRDEL